MRLPHHLSSAVAKLMNDAIAAQRLPGAVVVIEHGGNVVFHQAYGLRKLAGETGLRLAWMTPVIFRQPKHVGRTR
jgi:hypothetical protein